MTTMSPVGIHRKLDVGATGFHADRPNDAYRGIPHVLILFITQRLRRGHRNAIAGVHAHGVNVFDRADNHDVVGQIAHHFQLVLFPPEHGFLDEDLVLWTGVQAQRIASSNSSPL